MKRNIFKILGLALLALFVFACTAEQDVEPVISPDYKPVATFTNLTGAAVTEGDTIIYEITIDKMIDRSITFSMNQTDGTADDEDYRVEPAVLAAYSTSTQLLIITNQDFDYTASETITGEIGAFSIADRYLLNPSTTNPSATLTLNNFVSPSLDVSFAWDVDIILGGDAYSTADYIDFDFIVCPVEGFDINDPWATEVGIYDAVTGSHPEVLSMSGLDDGEYYLVADLWDNQFAGEGDLTPVGITTTFNRQGTTLIDHSIGQKAENKLIADLYAGGDDDEYFSVVLAKIIVANGKYTIVDDENNTVGTFKSKVQHSSRPDNLKR